MEIKKCSKCKEEKSLSEFHKDGGKNKDGVHSQCGVCKNINREKNRNKVRKLFAEYKKGLECQICGEKHSACLDFHHRDPDKKELNIAHAVGGYGIETIMNEITKCDILCANCHRKLHYYSKE